MEKLHRDLLSVIKLALTGESEPIDDFQDYYGNKVIPIESIIQRRTSVKQNRNRVVTLKDLIRQLEFYEQLDKKQALKDSLERAKKRLTTFKNFSSRDIINSKMRSILDEATDPWGIKITRVELKNILPPRDIQDAMEKQMRAERERREKILQAEGEKKSSILIAEGEKESAILRADAERESTIRIAEGEAEALLKIKQAEADGIKLLKEAGADDRVIALKSIEAMTKVADGQATKIIIPSDLQNIATLGVTLSETLKKENKK